MKKYFFLLAILALISCRKESGKFSLNGKFVDDITGEPVIGPGVISVDGNSWGNDVWFSTSYEEGIGNGGINNNGSFSAKFKPKNCDHYIFWFRQTDKYNNYWYPDNITINRSEFIEGRKDTTIRLPRLAILNINFRNTSPFDKNDRLQIAAYSINSVLPHGWSYQWANLQNCEIKNFCVFGGSNARGTLKAIVASDKVACIYGGVMKNGIERLYQDTIFCPRNTVTDYQLNY